MLGVHPCDVTEINLGINDCSHRERKRSSNYARFPWLLTLIHLLIAINYRTESCSSHLIFFGRRFNELYIYASLVNAGSIFGIPEKLNPRTTKLITVTN